MQYRIDYLDGTSEVVPITAGATVAMERRYGATDPDSLATEPLLFCVYRSAVAAAGPDADLGDFDAWLDRVRGIAA